MDDRNEMTPEDEMDAIITLLDENDNEVNFEFVDLIEYEGKEYIVLLPADDPDDSEVVILEVEPDPDDPEMENYLGVEDEEVLTAVFALFKERNSDSFTFED